MTARERLDHYVVLLTQVDEFVIPVDGAHA